MIMILMIMMMIMMMMMMMMIIIIIIIIIIHASVVLMCVLFGTAYFCLHIFPMFCIVYAVICRSSWR